MDMNILNLPFRKGIWQKEKERIYGYIFLLPSIILYTIFVLEPIIQSFLLSLKEWDGLSQQKTFVGLQNYADLITSSQFWNAFLNNTIWAALSIIPIALGFLLAIIVYQRKIIANTVFRVCFLFPFIMSQVITGVIWGWIYNPEWGTVNKLLQLVGLEKLVTPWLSNPNTVLIAVNLVGGWTWYGFCMIIFLAGLQSISGSVYEAARIDGASEVQILYYITIPLLRNHLKTLTIITLMFSFKVFDLVYVMTRGGPYNSSEVVGLLIYKEAFINRNIGSASAIAIFLILLVSLIYVVPLLYERKERN